MADFNTGLPSIHFMPPVRPVSPGNGVAAGLGNVSHVARSIAMDEKRKADQMAMVEADTQLTSAVQDFMYGENGAMYKRGKDSFDSLGQANKAFQTASDRIAKNLADGDQRRAYQKLAANHKLHMMSRLQVHIGNQRRIYNQQTIDAGLTSLVKQAGNSPAELENLTDKATALVLMQADDQGWSDQVTNEKLNQVKAGLNASAISGLIDSNHYDLAQSLVDKNSSLLSEKTQKNFNDLIKSKVQLQQTQSITKTILSLGKTKADALKIVSDITDPQVKNMVRRRVESNFSLQRELEQAQQAQLLQKANDVYEQSKGSIDKFRELMGDDYDKLPAATKDSIQKAFEVSHKPFLEQPTSAGVNLETAIMGWSKERKGAVTNTQLAQWRPGLTQKQFNHIRKMVMDNRDANQRGVNTAAGSGSQTPNYDDVVFGQLLLSGLIDKDGNWNGDDTDESARRKQRVLDDIHDYTNELRQKEKRDLSAPEVRKIVNSVIALKMFEPGTFDNGDDVPAISLSPEDIKKFSIDPKTIPDELRRYITSKILLSYGVKGPAKEDGDVASPQRVEAAIKALLIKDPDKYNYIVSKNYKND